MRWVLVLAAAGALLAAVPAQARPAQATRSGAELAKASVRESASSVVAMRPALGKTIARTAANANPATFTDPSGDGGTAPDITSVVVSNDANGQITFRINVTKLAVPSDVHIIVAIDSDENATTGMSGTDYLLIADLTDNSFGLARWDGSNFVDTPSTTATAGNDNTSLTFSVNRSDLGNTSGFGFWTRSFEGPSPAAGHMDDAPDAGTWNYELGPAAVLKLSVDLFHASRAIAGKPYLAVITVARSDGELADVTPDDVTCAAKVGTRPLHVTSTVAVGPAVGCSWRLPKKSRGKTLHASVTITLDGATVTKTFTARIK